MRTIWLWAGLFWLSFGAVVQAAEQSGMARVLGGEITDGWRGGSEISLRLSQGVPYRIFTMTEPTRLVVDFREADWSGIDLDTLDRSTSIAALRAGGFRPGWSRLIAQLTQPMKVTKAGLRLDEVTGEAALSITLDPTDAQDFAARAGAPHDPRWDLPAPAPVAVAPQRGGGDRPLVVMIDPGHGGVDPGAETEGATEAQLMLTMARELQETLRRAGGFDVRLTRDADVFVSLEARVAMAHRAGADLFVSLHADALDAGVARGATIYTLAESAGDKASAALAERHERDALLTGLDLSDSDDRVAGVLMDLARLDNTPRSHALARHLVDGIRNATGQVHKRPLRQAGFSVLKAADIPSVLVEVGFLSTRSDLKNLSDPIWRAGMAAGIRDGIVAWALEDRALADLRRQ